MRPCSGMLGCGAQNFALLFAGPMLPLSHGSSFALFQPAVLSVISGPALFLCYAFF